METSEKPDKKEELEATQVESSTPPPTPVTFTPGESLRKTVPAVVAGEKTPKEPRAHHGPDSSHVKMLAFAFLFILSISSGFFGGWLFSRNDQANTSTQKQQVILKTQGQLISNIAQNVGQSVVSVEVTSTSNINADNFFGTGAQGTTQQSEGTGIILTSDGLIVTNRHVAPAGTQSVSVTLSDGTTYNDVKVVGRTNSSDSLDIAFLQIQDTKGKKLVPAQIGDSSKVNVGDSVVAIGNALGQFQNTVTSGIISGHGRSVQASDSTGSGSENLEDLFQTDAAINEGNSGGPLVNLDGQIIGINTAIASGSQNIGFAIPINDVTGLISSVKQTGKLERPYLGVVYVSLTADIAKQYSLSVNNGAYIPPASVLGQTTILSGAPAANAGLKEGDVITKVNGTAIDQNTSLTSLLDQHAVGDKITVTVNRGGKTLSIDVTLGNAPTDS
ncbi:MAG: S1C family serine protease [Candidatus Saccharibacteria bacterium]